MKYLKVNIVTALLLIGLSMQAQAHPGHSPVGGIAHYYEHIAWFLVALIVVGVLARLVFKRA